jgi:hypothetical protein
VEAERLARRICGDDAERLARALTELEQVSGKSRSVAQVYRACAT